MIVASCPACQENVTVPIDARPTSVVRCPLCSAEFRLAEFLAQLPPPLIVVADAGDSSAEALTETRFGLHPVVGGETVAIDTGAAGDPGDVIPAFDFAPGSAHDDAAAAPRDVLRRSPRRQKNMVWELAKIVGGALLAVPAAQIILWWFVPYDWKRDLLGIGPSMSRVVPWMVPEKFRDPFAAGGLEEDRLAVESGGSESSRRPFLVPAPQRPFLPPRGESEWRDAETPGPASPAETAARGTSTDIRSPPPLPKPAEPAAGADLTGDAVDNPPSSADTPPGPEATATPPYGAAELQAALEQALQASVSWDTSPDRTEASRAHLNAEFYSAFARLGEILAFLRPDEEGARELVAAVRNLLLSFGRQPEKLVLIGNHAADWLDQPTRPNKGVFLFGTVKRMQPQGQLYATELELASLKKRTVTVVSRIDPQPFYAPGDRILMLAAVIEPPPGERAAADSPAEAIILGSFPLRLPQ